MNIAMRAGLVARVFDTLAWVVLVLGGLAVLGGFVAIFTESLWMGLFIMVGSAVYTALMWASVTLGTIVAGYIASRSEIHSTIVNNEYSKGL